MCSAAAHLFNGSHRSCHSSLNNPVQLLFSSVSYLFILSDSDRERLVLTYICCQRAVIIILIPLLLIITATSTVRLPRSTSTLRTALQGQKWRPDEGDVLCSRSHRSHSS